ncbi:putative glycolipid-binding domain-containing protein [Aureimonas populi]|uniref:Glycolipid-binding domain-containing protein n=1 Tax=Aureimonas populi TaxID=1701758 RepID=A0ABW5CJ85_9HYPH|nr:putative glycolipid-binding domain-containing protein [Aureimonas populi]
MFRPLSRRTLRWRPVAGEGLEHLTVEPTASGVSVRSVVIGERGGSPYGLVWQISCDPQWRVRQLRLRETGGRTLALDGDGEGRWKSAEGTPLPALDGCVDIDLAGSPFTNTLPIRRLGLQPQDGTADLRMVYVPFDSFEPMVDGQRYTCLLPGQLYRYQATDRSFSADLPVDEDGFVTDYPTLFVRV